MVTYGAKTMDKIDNKKLTREDGWDGEVTNLLKLSMIGAKQKKAL